MDRKEVQPQQGTKAWGPGQRALWAIPSRTVLDKRRSGGRGAAGLEPPAAALSTGCLLTPEPRHSEGDAEATGTPSVIRSQNLQSFLPCQVEIQAMGGSLQHWPGVGHVL